MIVPQTARFYRISDNSQTYTFNLEASRTGSYRAGLLIQERYNAPVMWLITADVVGGSSNVSSNKITVTGGGSIDISSATLSGTSLSITFNDTAWGGVMLIWFD